MGLKDDRRNGRIGRWRQLGDSHAKADLQAWKQIKEEKEDDNTTDIQDTHTQTSIY
jgi:hypothetical protein